MKPLRRSISLALVSSLALAFLVTALPVNARADDNKKGKHHKKDKKHHVEEASSNNRVANSRSAGKAFTGSSRQRVSVNSQQVVTGGSSRRYEVRGDRNDYVRNTYYSRPRTSFAISLGDGYAGRGYYYGPANSPYYYEAPGVSYYAEQRLIPRQYRGSYGDGRDSMAVNVQEALSQRGYYQGAIDGDIGSGSRRAIAHFQSDQGLRPTGRIDQPLLDTLGL
jgi:hypothetical protein